MQFACLQAGLIRFVVVKSIVCWLLYKNETSIGLTLEMLNRSGYPEVLAKYPVSPLTKSLSA
jgi:hypothetical protein